MNNENINFNYNECVKSYDKFGETIYQNICNGEKTSVPWGFSGYAILFVIILIFTGFGSVVWLLIKMLKNDI